MPLKKASEYAYLSARCHSVRAQLIDAETLKALSASRSIGEFSAALSTTLHGSFITDISAEGIHKGLTASFEYQRKRLIHDMKKRHVEIFKLFFETKYTLLDEKTDNISISGAQEIFHRIDREYILKLEKSMHTLPSSEQRQIRKIVGSYFDLLNLYNLVKYRLLYRLSVEETLSNMLPYAEKFTIPALHELCAAKNLEELSSHVKPVLGKGFNSYETFRQVLYSYHIKQLLTVWSGYPFSLAIPFSLLRLMEIEINDLRAITEGVAFDLGQKEIAAMLLGG